MKCLLPRITLYLSRLERRDNNANVVGSTPTLLMNGPSAEVYSQEIQRFSRFFPFDLLKYLLYNISREIPREYFQIEILKNNEIIL